jgi:uncharacterized protein
MKFDGEAERLRIYVNETDRWEGRPLYEAIIRAARDSGMAGASALRGIEGYGTSNRIHTVKVLHLSEALPIVIEIVDSPQRIASFLPVLDKMVAEGTVTLEKVRCITYRQDDAAPVSNDDIELESSEFAPEEATFIPSLQPNQEASELLAAARQAAAETRRVYVDSVDVLLVMLCGSNGMAGRALKILGIDCDSIERSLREEVSRDEPAIDYLATLEAKGLAEAKALGDDSMGAEHLLLALCQIRPSAATDTLMRLGAQPREICKEVLKAHGHRKDWQRWLADHPDM